MLASRMRVVSSDLVASAFCFVVLSRFSTTLTMNEVSMPMFTNMFRQVNTRFVRWAMAFCS